MSWLTMLSGLWLSQSPWSGHRYPEPRSLALGFRTVVLGPRVAGIDQSNLALVWRAQVALICLPGPLFLSCHGGGSGMGCAAQT